VESAWKTFNWAFAGVLEVYDVVQCGDYPSNESISFYNLGLYDYNFVKIGNPGVDRSECTLYVNSAIRLRRSTARAANPQLLNLDAVCRYATVPL